MPFRLRHHVSGTICRHMYFVIVCRFRRKLKTYLGLRLFPICHFTRYSRKLNVKHYLFILFGFITRSCRLYWHYVTLFILLFSNNNNNKLLPDVNIEHQSVAVAAAITSVIDSVNCMTGCLKCRAAPRHAVEPYCTVCCLHVADHLTRHHPIQRLVLRHARGLKQGVSCCCCCCCVSNKHFKQYCSALVFDQLYRIFEQNLKAILRSILLFNFYFFVSNLHTNTNNIQ